MLACSVDLNYLPTAVGRIVQEGPWVLASSVDLNYLPTAVGRIFKIKKGHRLQTVGGL